MKQIIKKGLKSLKNDGIIKTLKKGYRYTRFKIKNRKKSITLSKYVNVNDYDTVIIFENNFGWKKIMRQRPQQIANSLPDGTLMIYHSHEDYDYNNKDRINKLKDNLILVDLGYHRDMILEELANHNNKYLMIYSTDYIPYDRIEMYMHYDYQVIYEYVDDFNEDLSGKEMYKALTQRHKKLISKEPFISCTAKELYNNCANEGDKYITLISNGVDYDHFKNNQHNIPTDLIEIREKHKTIIMYYGALAKWFDYELVKELADNKDYGIVLLGQDYDYTIEKSGILTYDNIYYLGKKDYNDLPAYGYSSDLFIIPFLINDITKATSPVKIFEYMAMGKPIITTALPECKKYKSVLYSKDHKEFIKNIEKGISLIGDKDYLVLLDKEAKENTWESKAKALVDFANSSNYGKLQAEILDVLDNEKYDRIVVWRSPFGWNVPLFQRPQHIARKLAKHNCLVLYEVTPNTDVVKRLKKEEDNLYLVNFSNYFLKNILKEALEKIKKPKYLQIYSTNWSMSISELKEYENSGFKILYEYIDDISPELAGTEEIPEYILDKYNYAMNNKDVLIITTAKNLYEDVKNKRGEEKMTFSCNGVDYDHFQKIDKKYKFEDEFLSIIKNGKINVCYYGALAKWFDYELIRDIDATNKYNIILFGVKYDEAYDESKINDLKNVYFLGSRDYKVLKNYASKMDILTIPFVINTITQATSPLKLFEYMALHKPIVTTAMNECKNYESVLIGNTRKEFIEKLEEAYRLKDDKKYMALLDKEAKENDWDHKAEIIVELLKKEERK